MSEACRDQMISTILLFYFFLFFVYFSLHIDNIYIE